MPSFAKLLRLRSSFAAAAALAPLAAAAVSVAPSGAQAAFEQGGSVFVRDFTTGAVSAVAAGGNPAFSADGRFLAFESGAVNSGVQVLELATRLVTTVSHAPGGAAALGTFGSGHAATSAEGRFVAFDSDASNLVPGDAPGTRDVFVRDRQTGAITRVADGAVPALSGDGRWLAFQRSVPLLGIHTFLLDRGTAGVTPVQISVEPAPSFSAPAVSADGSVIAFIAGNGVSVLVRGTATLTDITVPAGASTGANAPSSAVVLSPDGRWVAFRSRASNLATGDTNGADDVFLFDRTAGTMRRLGATSRNAFDTALALSGGTPVVGYEGEDGALVLVDVGGRPLVLRPPEAQTVPPGGRVTFDVAATALGALSYQWLFNGTPVAGATGPTLTLRDVTPAQVGNYSVVVTTAAGSLTSAAGRLSVAGPPVTIRDGRLINVSSRAQTATGANVLTAGFVVTGSTGKPVLVRAIGPTLSQFGLTGVLATPQIRLFRAPNTTTPVAQTTLGWGGAQAMMDLFSRVGAFPLPAASADAVLSTTLAPGSYTAQVTGGSGVALVEVYDTELNPPAGASRLINLSSRAFVGTGGAAQIPGFVVDGTEPRRFLVRAIGPGLSPFGVTGVLATPELRIYRSIGAGVAPEIIFNNIRWGNGSDPAAVAAAAAQVGAFALATNSADCALLVSLPPGVYTAEARGAGTSTGVALVEVYEVPGSN